jgi:serine/threonine protein kinase
MSSSNPREEDLFNRALALAAGDRAAFLARECAGDTALRTAVELLLRLHTAAGSFLENPAPEIGATVALAPPRGEEKPGDRIGRYKLLQKLGEGGCGVVYMAEQEEPVHRRVALKIIKLGMDTKAVIARFEAERQALALMDHPNIAHVLDAGATDTGRPFFVMELVRGVPITKYCDEANLSTRARLGLFSQVCHAIQHAHQKGIIHRDVKPSNILVTLHDGEPVPKVIDFGIAKATQGRLTDQTLFTAFEQFIGTPAYMSPEQAEMSGLDIDTRSDIYSLGVLLYELLTGRPPFDPKTFLAAGLDEMRRMIREVEPPRPSTRLTTLTDFDRATIARLRGAAPTQLRTQLSGDLDWIVMKALEKNRTRRYESASAFAADIQRHLNNEPVIARPPSTGYLVQKLVRRHKLGFAAAGAIAAALVLGLAFSTWSFFREKAARERAVAAEREQASLREQAESARRNEAGQRRQAEANEQKAKAEALRSEQAFKFVSSMLRGVGPSAAAGRDTALLRDILDRTLQRLEHELADKPDVDAKLRLIVGSVYADIGDMAQAERMITESLERTVKLHGRDSYDAGGPLCALAAIRVSQGRGVEAEQLAREAAAILAREREPTADDQTGAAAALALAQFAQGKLNEAEAGLRTALGFAHHNPDAENSGISELQLLLAEVLRRQGRLGEAEELIRSSVALQRSRFGPDHPVVATSMGVLATVLASQHKLAEAETMSRDAIAAMKRYYGADHRMVMSLQPTHISVLLAQDRVADAEAEIRETLAAQKKIFGPNHPNVAAALELLASVLERQNKTAEAAAIRQELGAMRSASAVFSLVDFNAGLKDVMNLAQQNQLEPAETKLRDTIAVGTGHIAETELIQARLMLAGLVSRRGRPGDAEVMLREITDSARRAFGDQSEFVGIALGNLGQLLHAEDKLPEAEAALREAVAISKGLSLDGENAAVVDHTLLLAMIRARRGDAADATGLVRNAAAIARKAPADQRDLGLRIMTNAANKLRDRRLFPEEEAVQRIAVDFVRARDGDESVALASQLNLFASTLYRNEQFAASEAAARESAALRRKLLPPTNWVTANTESKIGMSLVAQKKFTEAEPILLASDAEMLRLKPAAPPAAVQSWIRAMRDNARQLVLLYEATGRPGQAAEWKKKGDDFAAQATAQP